MASACSPAGPPRWSARRSPSHTWFDPERAAAAWISLRSRPIGEQGGVSWRARDRSSHWAPSPASSSSGAASASAGRPKSRSPVPKAKSRRTKWSSRPTPERCGGVSRSSERRSGCSVHGRRRNEVEPPQVLGESTEPDERAGRGGGQQDDAEADEPGRDLALLFLVADRRADVLVDGLQLVAGGGGEGGAVGGVGDLAQGVLV